MDGWSRRLPKLAIALDSATALWKIVPVRDEEGRPLSDFMMLVPGLRNRPPAEIEATLGALHSVLLRHREVVFAHFNLSTNLLWVSVRNRPGLTLGVANALRESVPAAVLVAPGVDFAGRRLAEGGNNRV